MPREFESFLADMRDRAEWIVRTTADRSKQDLLDDRTLYDTVVRSFEIIGEAAKHIPNEYRREHPEIDWEGFARFRDVIAHSYFKLNPDIVWTAVVDDVRRLAKQLSRLLPPGEQ